MDNDLSKYGFEEGTTKENLTALVHGFQEIDELSNFNVFSIADNDAILSASLMDANNYKVFRQQGFILDAHSSNIHAGYFKDFGSGLKKNVELITREYIFPKENSQEKRIYRTYLSDLIKEKLKIDDKKYREIIEQIEDENSITKIEKINPEFANIIKEIFNKMDYGQRINDREYNEMLVSRPKIQGVFSYGQDFEDIPLFLRKYAQDNNLPILMFGN